MFTYRIQKHSVLSWDGGMELCRSMFIFLRVFWVNCITCGVSVFHSVCVCICVCVSFCVCVFLFVREIIIMCV